MIEKNKQNIVFVAGLHGNEKEPVKALTKNKINFILANPKACEKNIRFVDSDLNSSFGSRENDYESKQAFSILEKISEDDFVVDFHTTTADTSPFVIIVDEKMSSLAKRTGLKHVVVMKHNIKKGRSLLDYRNGISIEMGKHSSEEIQITTMRVIKNIFSGKKIEPEFYEVYDKITEPGVYKNFENHKDGFIPVLAGEDSYNFYGLKARKI